MRAGVRPRLAWPPWGTRPPSAPRPAGVGSSSRVSSQHFISHSTRNEGLPTEKGPTSADFGLYLITDSAMARRRGLPLETVVEEAIRGGVTMVQVREKASSTREFVHLSRRIKKVTARHGVPLIINDRVDVALAIGADGVHVGQDDMEAAVARSLLTKAGGRGRVPGLSSNAARGGTDSRMMSKQHRAARAAAPWRHGGRRGAGESGRAGRSRLPRHERSV